MTNKGTVHGARLVSDLSYFSYYNGTVFKVLFFIKNILSKDSHKSEQ